MNSRSDCAFGASRPLAFLSQLLLAADSQPTNLFSTISWADFQEAVTLAQSHHVIIRAMNVFARKMTEAGEAHKAEWAANAIQAERARIENALSLLAEILGCLQSAGHDVVVIKSLDHWPDLGSDLDLYSNADPAAIIRLVNQHFSAQLAPRSWGDRLAHKWNFVIPGLPELVEVHVGRLGQTGEQVAISGSLVERARLACIGDRIFPVPSAPDRLMICTLQRMYRHFYARLCDIVDTTTLLETENIDYADLRCAARAAGIWEGLATFLVIVSDYVEAYRGRGLDLPSLVRSDARFGGEELCFNKGFLRVTILPHSVRLYASELTNLLLGRQFRNTARLTLLPCLATAAAVGFKITGSDKGIW